MRYKSWRRASIGIAAALPILQTAQAFPQNALRPRADPAPPQFIGLSPALRLPDSPALSFSAPPPSTASTPASSSSSAAASPLAPAPPVSAVASVASVAPVAPIAAPSPSSLTLSVASAQTLAAAGPATNSAPSSNSTLPGPLSSCGAVGKYFNPTPEQYQDARTDEWLNNWWKLHSGTFNKTGGFAQTFGAQFIGGTDWTCKLSGSDSNCDLPVGCGGWSVMNEASPGDIEPAYYVLESVNRIHGYFKGFAEAMQSSGIGAALSKDNWGTTFYKSSAYASPPIMRELINIAMTLMNVAMALTVLIPPFEIGVAIFATGIIGGGVGAAGPYMQPSGADDSFEKISKMGSVLASYFTSSMISTLQGNNQLMMGQNFSSGGDIRDFLKGGYWVDYSGLDQVQTIRSLNTLLLSKAINTLYKQQKIFILGGGPCDDSAGLGTGPQEAKLCQDGKAWYIYYWEEFRGINHLFTHKKWGNVSPLPGAELLGKGDYVNITLQDIIKSSLASYYTAGYEYSTDLYQKRTFEAFKNGSKDPGTEGSAWEGTFTIPVCDIRMAQTADFALKDKILTPYGDKQVPQWCGAICTGNPNQTDSFITAANMKNFKSPTLTCKNSRRVTSRR